MNPSPSNRNPGGQPDRFRLAAVGSLLLLTVVQLLRLSWFHDYVPLWIEGLTEYQNALSTLLGFRTDPLPCSLFVGGLQIPLGVTAYVGGGFIYLHAPLVAAWFHGWTGDPYLFRYVGILAYLIDGWLIYFLASRFWNLKTAWWASVLWLTTPNLFFIAIADLQWELEPAAFAMSAVTLFILSFERDRASLFLPACAFLGFLSTTRLDAFVLLVVCVSTYLLVTRPASVLQPAARMLRKRKWLIPAGLAAIAAGALPFIVYNAVCEWGRLIPFVDDVILGSTFGETAPSLFLRLWLRIKQYFSVNALHQMPFLDIYNRNLAFGLSFSMAAAVLIGSARKRWISFPLLALILVIPLSLLSTGVLRPEHMIPFQVFTTLLVATGLSSDQKEIREIFRSKVARVIRHGLLIAALFGNLVVQAMDWRDWQRLPQDQDSIVNQSAPVALKEYLERFGPHDRVFFTNVGLHLYQLYMTANRFESEGIVSWEGEKQFVSAVESILRDRNDRRVFVGASLERDGTRFNLVRTKFLIETLQKHHVPYEKVTLSTTRRKNLYDIVTISPGAGIH